MEECIQQMVYIIPLGTDTMQYCSDSAGISNKMQLMNTHMKHSVAGIEFHLTKYGTVFVYLYFYGY